MINEAIRQRQSFLAPIGLICVIVLVFFIVKKLFRAMRLFVFSKIFPPNLKSYGDWAVITGGSSGIGQSYAREIARHGVNVVIVSNELDALKITCAEIREDYPVECSYIHVDFTKGKEAYERVEKELAGKDVGILLNGAGIAGNVPCYFLEETEKNLITMIDLHIESVVQMSLKVLPSMLKKKKGIIINLSSMASFKPMAFWNIYSPCKAFSNRFTKAVCWEYSDKGIEFQVLTPSFIKTRLVENMEFLSNYGRPMPSARTFARSAVRTIGRTEHTTGFWIFELGYFILEYVSERMINKISMPNILNKKKKT